MLRCGTVAAGVEDRSRPVGPPRRCRRRGRVRVQGRLPHRWVVSRWLTAVAALAAGQATAQQAATDLTATRFPVLEYRVRGNTVLPPLAVEEAVYPHLGPGRTAADVEAARAALEKAYTDAGYATVSVELPQQSVTGGVVTLQVAERAVGRLRVTGARYFLPSAVRAGAPSVAEGTVLNLPALQRDIVALNTYPDRRVTPELRPGSAPNSVDVDLQVEDTFPLHGSLELNNRRSRGTQDLRLTGSVRYDNLWQRGDSATVGYTVAPQRRSDAEVFSASYLWRVPRSSVSVLGNVIRSDSDVATVGSTNVIGRGTVAGVRVLVPLGGGGDGFSHTASIGVDRKDFDENLRQGADRTTVPILYYPVSAAYQASWYGERASTDVGATLTFGFRGLGSDRREFELKRFFADPSFSHLRGNATHLRRFANDIQLWGNLEAQWSPDSLISNEQFGLGGLDSVRGYTEVEALADFGVTAQAEIRSPSLAPRLGRPFDELRFHYFVDGGTGAINRPLPEQQRGSSLVSTGAGARMRIFERVNGSLEGAVALTNGAETRSGAARALFRLWGEF